MKNLKYIFVSLLLLNSCFTFSMEESNNNNNNNNNNNFTRKKASKEESDRLGIELLKIMHKFDIQEIKNLIIQGANVNVQDGNGNTPLLIASKGSVMEDGEIVNLKIAKILIKAKANTLIRNNANKTALDYAYNELAIYKKMKGMILHSEYLQKLINFLEEAKTSQIKQELLFQELTEAISNNEIKKIKEILIPNPDLIDQTTGNNALHIAAKKNNYLMFNCIMIMQPALFDKENYNEQTATDEYPEIICLLIAHKRLTLVEENKNK